MVSGIVDEYANSKLAGKGNEASTEITYLREWKKFREFAKLCGFEEAIDKLEKEKMVIVIVNNHTHFIVNPRIFLGTS